jgi:hypothetical protein
VFALPISLETTHALGLHVVGQSPSHFSAASRTMFPHVGLQSLSVLAFAPFGQHLSPPMAAVIGMCTQWVVHCAADPIAASAVQASPSSQSAGQSPSQFSPVSTTPLPHEALQSLSAFAFAPGGQQ